MSEELDCKELINKFIADEITDSEMDVLKSCLEKNADNRRFFNQENELWQESVVKKITAVGKLQTFFYTKNHL